MTHRASYQEDGRHWGRGKEKTEPEENPNLPYPLQQNRKIFKSLLVGCSDLTVINCDLLGGPVGLASMRMCKTERQKERERRKNSDID